MAMKAADYRHQMIQLLPPSAVLDTSPASNISKLFDGLSLESERIENRIDILKKELNPQTAFELLNEFEAMFGLPSPCAPLGSTITERQNNACAKMVERGGQSRDYFIQLAASMGIPIIIERLALHNVERDVNAGIYGQGWQYVWMVHTSASNIQQANVSSGVADPIRSWGFAQLECTLRIRRGYCDANTASSAIAWLSTEGRCYQWHTSDCARRMVVCDDDRRNSGCNYSCRSHTQSYEYDTIVGGHQGTGCNRRNSTGHQQCDCSTSCSDGPASNLHHCGRGQCTGFKRE